MCNRLELHEMAANNFNAKGLELLAGVKELPRDEGNKRQYQPEFQTSATISDNMTEKIRGSTIDMLSWDVSEIQLMAHNNALIGLAGEDCAKLNRLAEALQRTADFKPRLSFEFIRSTILDWIEQRVRSETEANLSEFVLARANAEVKIFEIWVPMANLTVQRELSLGPVRIRSLNREIFDTWLGQLLANADENRIEHIRMHSKALREKYQGLAAAYVALRAEAGFAVEKALEKAEEVASLLRVFHPANASPRAVYHCRPLGSESKESYSALVIDSGQFSYNMQHARIPFSDRWDLSDEAIATLEGCGGVGHIRKLLGLSGRSNFQQQILDALMIYSRNTLAKDPTDKLVYILVALESILLKSRTEGVQQNIADRLAFCLGGSLDERKEIVKLTKDCYEFRSRFIHHGQSLDDLSRLQEFMRRVWSFFIALPAQHDRFSEKVEFIELIENMKYSVP